jgi:methanethiol oxidase
MALLRPDPTFYPSLRLAMRAPAERLAYVAALNPPSGTLNDAMLVIDVDPASASYGKRVGQTVLPNAGDELHHFGWNACSSALCPYAPHPHIERRYLVVPGPPLFANPHLGYQARSAEPVDRKGHRT